MKIERAVREKTFTLTSIAGPSGSGKTYSAILYARGLVGETGKIGFIDTENKRSRFYADVGGGFDVIDMDPPFTSARYIEAIDAFQDAGYTAIIIDSISHEWEGTGGVLEQAEAIEEATKRAGLHCWKKPKSAHKKLMNDVLQTKAHLIFCCRVKEKVTQVKTGGKTEIVNEGFVVVQEKSFIYEMTVSMMLEEGTHVPIMQKCPDELLPGFPQGKQITAGHGNAVRMWADKGTAIDPEFKALRKAGLDAANQGTAVLGEWWKTLGGPRQKEFAALKDTFKSIAADRDLMAAELKEHDQPPLSERLGLGDQQEALGRAEGFDRGFVARETAALAGGAATEQEPSSDAPFEDDAGSVDHASPGDHAADHSAIDAPPGEKIRSTEDATMDAGPATGESSVGSASPLPGEEPGPEAGAIEAPDGQVAAPASADLSEADRDWLKLVGKLLWAATGMGEQQVLKNQFEGAKANYTPDTISRAARDRGNSIYQKCKLVCFGEADSADTLVQIAMVACCEPKELVA